MNRFEIFLALVFLFILAVYTLRTCWFDRFMNWVLRAPAKTTEQTDKKDS